MDLLKEEDISRNPKVIAVGYGKEYEKDERFAKRPLKFERMTIVFKSGKFNYNLSIVYYSKYAKICGGRS